MITGREREFIRNYPGGSRDSPVSTGSASPYAYLVRYLHDEDFPRTQESTRMSGDPDAANLMGGVCENASVLFGHSNRIITTYNHILTLLAGQNTM